MKKKNKKKAKSKTKSKAKGPGLFVRHIEKMVLGACLLVMLLLMAKSMGIKPIAFTPEQLSQAATQAKSSVVDRTVPGLEVLPEDLQTATDWGKKAKEILLPVAAKPYEMITLLKPLEDPGSLKRVMPTNDANNLESPEQIFPLEGLLATAGIGALQIKDPRGNSASGSMMGSMGGYEDGGMGSGMSGGMGMSGANLKGKRWITLTGLIPYAKQLRLYSEFYAAAEHRHPLRDLPIYVTFVVERADYDPTNPTAPLQWADLNAVQQLAKEGLLWAGNGPQVVPPSFLPRFIPGISKAPLAHRLPPIMGKRFGAEVAHPPAVPLLSDEAVRQMRLNLDRQEELQEQMNTPEAILRQMASGGGMGGMGGSGGYGDEGMSMGGMDSYGSGMDMGGYSGGMGMMGGDPEDVELLESKLFRYFDFNVEPDKSYKYRVKLVLANPNYEIPERYLEDPATTSIETIEAEFSEISPAATVPLDSRLLVGSITAPSRPYDASTGSLACIYFDMKEAMESSGVFENIQRGKVANFKGQTITKPRMNGDPYGGSMGMGYGDEGMMDGYGGNMGMMGQTGRGGTRRPPRPEAPKKVDYMTDVCVLDLMGGDKLLGRDRKNVTLGKIIFLDPGGELSVQTEADDYEDFTRYKPVDRSSMNGMGSDGYGDEYGGEYGGGSPY